jgi:hypothetical protein
MIAAAADQDHFPQVGKMVVGFVAIVKLEDRPQNAQQIALRRRLAGAERND